MVGLVTEEAEKELLNKLLHYYKKLYPGLTFDIKEETLSHREIGEIYYTYPGEEAEATAREKMVMISEAITHGYNTPIILLKKNNKKILLDGHRRIRVAYAQGLGWRAYVLAVKKEEIEFGIESMIMGKVADLFSRE
ncbi:MAG: hypothetical protein QXT45_00820 [Candidatus Bilamarchaeaceae archaeon]